MRRAWKKHGATIGRRVASWYRAWTHMKDRCLNKSNKDYHLYGGRGITVCQKLMDAAGFYEDMGDRPTSEHTLERKDNDGNYEPGNCVWATKKEQGRNRSTNHLITYNGRTLCITEWAEILGIPYRTLWMRLTNLEWPVEKALTSPVQAGKPLRRR
jgi:hypothetical protein